MIGLLHTRLLGIRSMASHFISLLSRISIPVSVPITTTMIDRPVVIYWRRHLPIVNKRSRLSRSISTMGSRFLCLGLCGLSQPLLVISCLFELSYSFLERLNRVLFLKLILFDAFGDDPQCTELLVVNILLNRYVMKGLG